MSNTTTLVGNLTRNPELRFTREGTANANFGLAVTRRWPSRSGDGWDEATSFFDVVCWRDLAEHVAVSLAKGMRVVVTGRLEQRVWETETGERRQRIEVLADDIGVSLRFALVEVSKVERRSPESEDDGSDTSEELEGASIGA
jgi:single-strand DNA-binding protein